MKQTKLPKSKKRSFSSFDLASAYKQLGIKTLTHWNLPDIAIAICRDYLCDRDLAI